MTITRRWHSVLYLFLAACLAAVISGCGKSGVENKTSNPYRICESRSYPGNGYSIRLAEDGDTIEELAILFNFDEKVLKDMGGEAYTLDETYKMIDESQYAEYQALAGGNNASLPYFKTAYMADKDQHQLRIMYTYQLNNKVLLNEMKSPSSSFYEWISHFELQDAYDKEKGCFSYKKLKTSHRFQNMETVKCRKGKAESLQTSEK